MIECSTGADQNIWLLRSFFFSCFLGMPPSSVPCALSIQALTKYRQKGRDASSKGHITINVDPNDPEAMCDVHPDMPHGVGWVHGLDERDVTANICTMGNHIHHAGFCVLVLKIK